MKKIINYILILIAILLSLYQYFTYGYKIITDILLYIGLIPILFIPKILRKFFKFNINESIETIYLIFIILAYVLGSVMKFYGKIYWFDSFNHFLSGILSALLAILVLKKFKVYDNKNVLFNIIYMIAFTLMIATFWEIIEFSIDNLCGSDTQKVLTTGVNDTMKDMICALLGSILFIPLKQLKIINKFISTL